MTENPRNAVLRELREEIGLTGHGSVRHLFEADGWRDLVSILIVRDVEYAPPKWSWEVENVLEAPITHLPSDVCPSTAAWLQKFKKDLTG